MIQCIKNTAADLTTVEFIDLGTIRLFSEPVSAEHRDKYVRYCI